MPIKHLRGGATPAPTAPLPAPGGSTGKFDFSLSASPQTITISSPKEEPRYKLSIGGISGGRLPEGTKLRFDIQGLPPNSVARFVVADFYGTHWLANSTNLNFYNLNQDLDIFTSSRTPEGTYKITVLATGLLGDGCCTERSITLTLVVARPFDFSLSPSPTSDKVWQGGMADYLVKVEVPQRRDISLRVAVRDLPPGAKALVIPCGDMETSAVPRTQECQFALSGRLRTSEIKIPQSTGEYLIPPEVVQIPQPQSFLLVVFTSLKTPPGQYGIKITVYTEDRKVSRDAEVTLMVEKADFSLSVRPSAPQELAEGAPEGASWTISVSSVGTPQTLLLDAVLRVRGDSAVAELRKGPLRVEWEPKRVPLLGPAYDGRSADLARAGEEAYWTATKPGALEEPLTLRVFLRQVILPPPLRALRGQDYEVEIQVTATREDGIAKSVTFLLLVRLGAPQRPREEAPPEPQRADIPGRPNLPAVPPADAQEPRILLLNVVETTTGVQVERDQVTTISGAFADVVLGDRGKVRIGPKSKVVFGRKARDLNAEADLVVIMGKVHLSWKAESAPSTPPPGGIPPSEIKPGGTPIGGIGIHYGDNTVRLRGTEVLLEVAEDGAGALTVLDGVVEVRSRQEPGKVVLVMGGQRLLTRPSAPLPEPIAADKSFLSKVPPLTAALADPDLTTGTWWAQPSQGSKAPKARGGLSCASPRARDLNLLEPDRGVGALDPILFFMIGLLGLLWYARRR